jgi:hypothetical protein
VVSYAPRRDRWLKLMLWATVLEVVAVGAFSGGDAVDLRARVALCVTLGGGIARCILPLYALTYTLSDDALRVPFGPLDSMESVRPGVGSGLAWSRPLSLRGLTITRRGKMLTVVVSPADPDAFLSDLASRCPQRALTRVIESARCLLWEAGVEERDGALEWRVDRVASDRSVLLDLELEEDHPW